MEMFFYYLPTLLFFSFTEDRMRLFEECACRSFPYRKLMNLECPPEGERIWLCPRPSHPPWAGRGGQRAWIFGQVWPFWLSQRTFLGHSSRASELDSCPRWCILLRMTDLLYDGGCLNWTSSLGSLSPHKVHSTVKLQKNKTATYWSWTNRSFKPVTGQVGSQNQIIVDAHLK